MRQSVFLFALTIYLFACVAQADNKTHVNDPKAAAALLGEHRFTWQSISWTRFGKATITNDNGVYRLDAKQQINNLYATIQGVITAVNSRNFLFKGIIKTANHTGSGGAPCIREGEFAFFYRQQSSRGWRLSSMESPCGTGVDYLDIYITQHSWRPRLSKADKLAKQWGIGILLKNQPGKTLTKTDVVPDATMQFHFRPNGSMFAITIPSQHYPVGLKRVPGTPHAVVQNTKDYVTLNYDAQAIVVHQRKDNFAAIFSNSLHQQSG